jgi:hypothetical protein
VCWRCWGVAWSVGPGRQDLFLPGRGHVVGRHCPGVNCRVWGSVGVCPGEKIPKVMMENASGASLLDFLGCPLGGLAFCVL